MLMMWPINDRPQVHHAHARVQISWRNISGAFPSQSARKGLGKGRYAFPYCLCSRFGKQVEVRRAGPPCISQLRAHSFSVAERYIFRIYG